MTCKNCYHYDACSFYNKNLKDEYDPIEWQRDNFKDKSYIVELPYEEKQMTEVKEHLDEIIEKYWHEDDEFYSQFRYDEHENEFDMMDEIKEYFESTDVPYTIGFEEGFSSCGYDNDFLAVAWLCNGKIELRTVLLESM